MNLKNNCYKMKWISFKQLQDKLSEMIIRNK